jgi:tetratricopeptide (TPR) repeat protein
VTDDAELLELRRRVREDPASLAFAQLAEQLRRTGNTDEAVGVCRAGLVHHPANLTARVTLGRALVELGRLDEAFTELTFVLDATPGNLAAIRALAEIYQRRGMISEALVHYRRALQLAQHDRDLAHTVGEIEQNAAQHRKLPPPRIEELFDFDALMAQLGTGSSTAGEVFVPLKKPPESALDAVVLANDDQDAFAVMERQLREREEQRLLDERQTRLAEAERKRLVVLRELEAWLVAIADDRRAGLPST